MESTGIDYNEHDQLIWDEELAPFVPDRIFDAHTHLFSQAILPEALRSECKIQDTDFNKVRNWSERLYPGREVHYLILGYPHIGMDTAAHNAMMLREAGADSRSRMNRLVTPQCSLADIETDIKQRGFMGLKPYRYYSVTGDIQQCRIRDYLPEEQLALADSMGLWVTLHMSRHHGCADEGNLSDLEEFTTKRFPGIKWILAHCARSFTYWQIERAIDRLRALPNIWYDLSAVCDLRVFITLFQKEKIERLFYGSDGVDSTYFRGKYVAFGRAWQDVNTDRIQQIQFPHCDSKPILCIYEELLAIKHAAQITGLTQSDVEDIFWRNAMHAFNIDWP